MRIVVSCQEKHQFLPCFSSLGEDIQVQDTQVIITVEKTASLKRLSEIGEYLLVWSMDNNTPLNVQITP